jgi:hypothetical protein
MITEKPKNDFSITWAPPGDSRIYKVTWREVILLRQKDYALPFLNGRKKIMWNYAELSGTDFTGLNR